MNRGQRDTDFTGGDTYSSYEKFERKQSNNKTVSSLAASEIQDQSIIFFYRKEGICVYSYDSKHLRCKNPSAQL